MKKQSKIVEIEEPKYKVRSDLGFFEGKRKFFVDEKLITLIEGEIISNEDFLLFNERAMEMLFEKV